MVLRTPVIERQVYCLSIAILDGGIHSVHQPLQTAVVYKVTCRLRRSHCVAVLILHITHRNIDIAVVQFGWSLIEFYHQLVASADEAELQVRHFLIRNNRCCIGSVDALLDNIDIVNKQIVAYQYVGRFLRCRVKLIAWLALVVQVKLLAVSIRHCFDSIILLAFLTVEAQISHQACLVTVRTLRRVSADKLLRQSLSKEQQFIHVTGHSIVTVNYIYSAIVLTHFVACSTDERITAADATKAVCLEGCFQILINIYVSHVASAVHCHGVVVPLVVAPIAWDLGSKAVRTIHQFFTFETDVEQVLSTDVFLQTATVAQQCSTSFGICLKPEHKGVVMVCRTVDGVLV